MSLAESRSRQICAVWSVSDPKLQGHCFWTDVLGWDVPRVFFCSRETTFSSADVELTKSLTLQWHYDIIHSLICPLCPQVVQGWARSYQQRRPLLTKDVNAWVSAIASAHVLSWRSSSHQCLSLAVCCVSFCRSRRSGKHWTCSVFIGALFIHSRTKNCDVQKKKAHLGLKVEGLELMQGGCVHSRNCSALF